jgi:glycosyltransferase involved in cell wall biosynthesis
MATASLPLDVSPAIAPVTIEELRLAVPPRASTTTRVLHVINGEHYAGAERVQDLLALRLPRLGFNVGFACLKPGEFARVRQSHKSPVHALPMRHRFDLWQAQKLAKIVRRDGYALVHTHTARSALVGSLAAAMAGVPMVHHVHSPTLADTTHRLRNRINAIVERRCLARAAALITVSQSIADYVETQGLGNVPVRVVPNGVRMRGPLVQRDTPRDRWVLGAVALFRPRKGVEVLLESMASLVAQDYDIRLRAVGAFETPEYESQIKRLADELGLRDRITWRGFQRNVDGELTEMDLFVLPSLFGEGMPMVVLEAMATGVPVVASRVEGVEELIGKNSCGVIVEPGDSKSLVDGLRSILDEQADWRTLRHAAHRRQVEQFSDLVMAKSIAAIYREVLNEKAGR